jgi:hypothetical protein
MARIGDNAVHLHWAILGFDFAMPAAPGSPDPSRPGDSEPVVVQVADNSPSILVSGESGGTVERPVDEGPFVAVCEPIPPGFLRTNSVAALPLCERARRERSGVLLA